MRTAKLATAMVGVALLATVRGNFAHAQARRGQLATAALGTLVAEALQNNPELRAAAKEIEAANQRVRPAGALEDPMLEAGFINLPIESLRFNREDMTMKMLGLSQKLPYPGKRALRERLGGEGGGKRGPGLG